MEQAPKSGFPQSPKREMDRHKYRLFFEHANDGFMILEQNRFTDCNHKAAEMLGRSCKELVGLTPWDISPARQPDGRDSREKALEIIKSAASGKSVVFEWTHTKSNDTPLEVEVSLNQVQISQTPVIFVLLRDITERKLAQQALNASEERYRRIVEDQTEFIVRWLPDGTRTFVNESYCRQYGLTREDAIGSSFFPLISEEDRDTVQRRISSLTPEKPVSTGEHKVIMPDGTVGWNQWTDRTFFDEKGSVIEYQSVGQDITDRKLAEQALQESEDRFRKLSESTFEGIAITDKGRIVDVNEQLVKMLRIKRDELVGMKAASFVAHESREVVEQHMQSGSEEPYEHIARRADGSFFPVEVRARAFPFEGQKFRVTVIRDITERKQAENDLKNALAQVEQLKNRLQEENIYLRDEIKVEHQFGNIIGMSDSLKKTLRQVEQVAATDTNVLILGETGTGKEIIARSIHELSLRKERPLVKVNCAALPANLIESELFGHEKGAFTGALTRRTGRFELANSGSIFLDEIGDLPLELQVKLLRVLQEGEFERLGSHDTVKVDVRIIAATNRNLEKSVQKGTFREDLYFRLNVFPIHLPPLRKRREDIALLARHFIDRFNTKLGKQIDVMPTKVMNALQTYDWPGNVRELENIIERAMVISKGTKLELGDWFLRENGAGEPSTPHLTLQEMEKRYVLETLDKTLWRVSGKGGAAEILGMKPTTLEARMKKMGIKRSR